MANAFVTHLLAAFPSYFTNVVGRELLLSPQFALSDEKSGGAAAQQALYGIALRNR